MEYTVQKLAHLAGISTRTLRFYDEIDLLKPARINSSGYRIYGKNEVDELQQILFYRELGFSLDQIKEIVHAPEFDKTEALIRHRIQLLGKKRQLETLIINVEKSIAAREGRIKMSDKEKFEGLKQNMIDENEIKYGKEIRKKYGDEAVNRSNEKVTDYEAITHLEKEMIETLVEAFHDGDPASPIAQKAVDLHKQWLMYYWHDYSLDAHKGIARMYVDDERFTSYYDKYQPGLALFLRDAVQIYTTN
ncbi:MerR family transcriptional regulator [Shimazuella sp. AN120528]|uniref:MerR family transcriptional regulator n=1 Tax=Shimazuella soli TaxID=1892854 RepID=UPI001F0FB889|nr:MerR family transcriptional regulator [Shimazuella soli]MCH5585422.1 MerR family transcriptional regulator [Shimazuella soli]